MKIIDLTIPLRDKMEVYPGDPEVVVREIHTLSKEGWRLRKLSFSSHIGTHVNAPYHMVEQGETLDQFKLDAFIGPAKLYSPAMKFDKEMGVIFHSTNITQAIANQLVKTPPKFVGLSARHEFDVSLEKQLLEAGILSFEGLVNTDLLPQVFEFYGIPLSLPGSDGSPVRAFAKVG